MPEQQYSAYSSEENEGPGPVGYLAIVLAWAVPGLGHMMIGQKARGVVFMVTVHALFAAGLLIGGIRSIKPPDQAIWTYTQFLTGWPMLVASRMEDSFARDYLTHSKVDPTKTNIQLQYYADAAAARVDLGDPVARQKFTQDFIAKYPLFSYHPKVQDMGAVYCGIAGMLNLLVMFDVLLRVTGSVREDPKQKRAGGGTRVAEVAA